MESRKRPHADDAEQSLPKKRALSDDLPSPDHLNGVAADPDEPKDSDSLEAFRKDAIFRRMKHYSREHERSQARVAELERRRHTCEAGLAALAACWTQLIGTIRLLVQPEDLPTVEIDTDEILGLTTHMSDDSDSEYVEALREKMHATSELVTAFVRVSGQMRPAPLTDDVYGKCQKAQTECSTLRSELSLARMKLRNVESEKDQYHAQLVAAEMRIDRLQSKTLAGIEGRPTKVEVKAESPEEPPASPAPLQPATNGVHEADVDKLRALLETKKKQVSNLGQEYVKCQEEGLRLSLRAKAPSEEVVLNSPYCKLWQVRVSNTEHEVLQSQSEIARLKEVVKQLEKDRQDFEDDLTASSEQTIQDLKAMLAKRDIDILRLREQRDQSTSELHERKARDHAKSLSLNEYKALLGTYGDRIKVLESEVTRLKTRLAAAANDEDLMTFLFRRSSENVTYVEDLRERLAAADTRATALADTLASYEESHPDIAQHMKSEADTREQLTQVRTQLEKYQSVYGDSSSTLTPNIQALSEQLQQTNDQCQKLRLQEKQRDQAEFALYAELDKLSAAWEALDRQVKSKVFDLSAMEERVVKSGIEKAKSENKFYATMREKEAIETERKNLLRNVEKQAKALEKVLEAEKILLARVGDLEKEVLELSKALKIQREATIALEKENNISKTRLEGDIERYTRMHAVCSKRSQDLERIRDALHQEQDNLVQARLEAERYTTKMKALSQNHSAGSREVQLQTEVDKCMSILKCSTCNMNMRNTVITKCMHSFCKSCVDSRIATRQRKCPACNLPFSQGEVQTLFFQ